MSTEKAQKASANSDDKPEEKPKNVETTATIDPDAKPDVELIIDIQFMPLRVFADHNADKYGIELMAGFYHEQEQESHYADTELNWHQLMEEFKGKEVK